MRVDGKGSRICGSTYNGLDCFDINAGTSFSIQTQDIYKLSSYAFNLCWIDKYGVGTCLNSAVPTVRLLDIQQGSGVLFSVQWLEDHANVSQSTLVYPYLSDLSVTNLSVGPFGFCVDDATTSFCSSSLPMEPVSSLSLFLPNGTSTMHTSTMFFVDVINQVNGWRGLPGCDGVTTPCASFSTEVSITSGFDGLPFMKELAIGNQQGYGIDNAGTLHCWGAVVCPAISDIEHVTAYDGGACVEFATSATCFGVFSHTFLYNSFSCGPNDIDLTAMGEMQCAACPLGFGLSPAFLQFGAPDCVECNPGFYRGPGMVSCAACPPGSVPSPDQSRCIACLPYQYQSSTVCLDCDLGSQSDGLACFGCPSPLVRDASMTSCSECPYGFLPANGQTVCLSCPSPSIWVGNDPSTWTNGTCSDCPPGQYPVGFSCSICVAPNIRTTDSACVSCPDGYQPNASRTVCFPCSGNTVRTGLSPFCFECPTGYRSSDEYTRCKKPVTPFLSASQSALLAFGILIFVASMAMRRHIPESRFVLGVTMGLFFIGYAIALPSTRTK